MPNKNRTYTTDSDIQSLKEIKFVAKYLNYEDNWNIKFSEEPIESCSIHSARIGFATKNGNNKIKVGYVISENNIYIDSRPGECDSGAPVFIIHASNENYTGSIYTYTIYGRKRVG
jgi:hypothetical protein